MTVTGYAQEIYMEYVFDYENAEELSCILFNLREFKKANLVKGDIDIYPEDTVNNNGGSVYAAVRADSAIDTLLSRFRHGGYKTNRKIQSVDGRYIDIE